MLQIVPPVDAFFVSANQAEPVTRVKASRREIPGYLSGWFDVDELSALFNGRVYAMISDRRGITRGLALNVRATAMIRDYVVRYNPGAIEWLIYGDGLLIEPKACLFPSVSDRVDIFLDPRRR